MMRRFPLTALAGFFAQQTSTEAKGKHPVAVLAPPLLPDCTYKPSCSYNTTAGLYGGVGYIPPGSVGGLLLNCAFVAATSGDAGGGMGLQCPAPVSVSAFRV